MGDRVHSDQQYSIARRATPSGFRKKGPEHYESEEIASRFAGLPEGIESHRQLLAAFKAAAPRLGISRRLVDAVDFLFGFTQPQDWQANSRPIVWPSARTVQDTLLLSDTQARDLTRKLARLRLIAMKDSADGKRYGRRDPRGRIVEAYGFDLSPLAVRLPELQAGLVTAKLCVLAIYDQCPEALRSAVAQ
jgi:replication initiation protein RepC